MRKPHEQTRMKLVLAPPLTSKICDPCHTEQLITVSFGTHIMNFWILALFSAGDSSVIARTNQRCPKWSAAPDWTMSVYAQHLQFNWKLPWFANKKAPKMFILNFGATLSSLLCFWLAVMFSSQSGALKACIKSAPKFKTDSYSFLLLFRQLINQIGRETLIIQLPSLERLTSLWKSAPKFK